MLKAANRELMEIRAGCLEGHLMISLIKVRVGTRSLVPVGVGRLVRLAKWKARLIGTRK